MNQKVGKEKIRNINAQTVYKIKHVHVSFTIAKVGRHKPALANKFWAKINKEIRKGKC